MERRAPHFRAARHQQQRIEIALERRERLKRLAGKAERSARVETEAGDAGLAGIVADERTRSARKADYRKIGVTGMERGDDRTRRLERERTELGFGQAPRPGVEDLHRLGTRLDLRREMGDRRLDQEVDELPEAFRRPIGPELRRRLVGRAAAADHIGRDRPGRPGEADERRLGGKALLQAPHRLIDGRQPLDHRAEIEIVDLLGPGDRIEHRPLSFPEGDLLPERIGHDENVGKEDRRVEAVSADGLERHLLGKLGRVAEIEKAAGLLARLPVLGQIASGLAHQPDRRPVGRLALERLKESLRPWSGHVAHRIAFYKK
jgi:hypothetical protein